MSAETTAKVLTRMLENKPFRTQVADDPEALAKLDLTKAALERVARKNGMLLGHTMCARGAAAAAEPWTFAAPVSAPGSHVSMDRS